MDKSTQLLQAVMDYRKGEGKYNFSNLSGQDYSNAAADAWNELEDRITEQLNTLNAKEVSE